MKTVHKADFVSTLKLYRKSERHRTEKGEITAQHCGPVSVTKSSDKKFVTMILTHHSHDTRTVTISVKEAGKPISVLDYNQ
jgi:hypothetical protein